MPQYLYRLHPARAAMLTDGPSPVETKGIADHLEYLMHAARTGRALLFGRTQTSDANTFGIVIFEAPSDHLAAEFMRADPAVARGVMTAVLFPFRIAGGSLAAT